MILAPAIRQRYFSSNGAPLAGGKLYSYIAGTTTPQATYTDQGGGTPNTNPVILDANGEASVWLDPSSAYKFVLNDSSDVTQWTTDQVSGAGGTGVPQWNSNSTYQQGNIVLDASGVGILYVSLQNNNLGNVLSSVAYWRALGGNLRTVAANTTLVVTDEVVRSNSTSGNLTHILPSCASTPIGKRITIKDIGTGGFTTSVQGSGTDTVGGSNVYPTGIRSKEALEVMNTGSAWEIVSSALMVPDASISTAKLADAAVATAKLIDGAVTQAKLAARATGTTVAAGGVAISESSLSFTATSNGPVTNLSVTLTTTGRPVAVLMQSTGATGSLAASRTGGQALVRFVIYRGGVSTYFNELSTNSSSTSSSVEVPPACVQVIDPVAAGTYTYSINVELGASTTVSVTNCCLVAYEI